MDGATRVPGPCPGRRGAIGALARAVPVAIAARVLTAPVPSNSRQRRGTTRRSAVFRTGSLAAIALGRRCARKVRAALQARAARRLFCTSGGRSTAGEPCPPPTTDGRPTRDGAVSVDSPIIGGHLRNTDGAVSRGRASLHRAAGARHLRPGASRDTSARERGRGGASSRHGRRGGVIALGPTASRDPINTPACIADGCARQAAHRIYRDEAPLTGAGLQTGPCEPRSGRGRVGACRTL